MPLEPLSDDLIWAGAQFRATWRSNPSRGLRELIAAWTTHGVHTTDNGLGRVFTCSMCDTPFPWEARWFYVRPPSNVWSRCRYCYTEYQHTYNQEVRKGKRRVELMSDRKFGLELEFIGSSRKLQRAMRDLGISCVIPGYTHEVMPDWKIVPDGSVASGAELVSPILSREEGAVQNIEMACTAMRKAPVSTDRSTGLHVHHTVRDLSTTAFKRVVQLWYNAQPAISGLVAQSRRTQRWCRSMNEDTLEDVLTMESLRHTSYRLARQDRYVNLNVCSYDLYGTLEVRWHQGTRDSRKILGWTALFQALVGYASSRAPLVSADVTLETLLERLEHREVASPSLVRWAKERYKALNASTNTAAQARAQLLQRLRREQEAARAEGETCVVTTTCNCASCRRNRGENAEDEEYTPSWDEEAE